MANTKFTENYYKNRLGDSALKRWSDVNNQNSQFLQYFYGGQTFYSAQETKTGNKQYNIILVHDTRCFVFAPTVDIEDARTVLLEIYAKRSVRIWHALVTFLQVFDVGILIQAFIVVNFSNPDFFIGNVPLTATVLSEAAFDVIFYSNPFLFFYKIRPWVLFFFFVLYYSVFGWYYVQEKPSQANWDFSWQLITIRLGVVILEVFAQCVEDLMIHNNLTYKDADLKKTNERSWTGSSIQYIGSFFLYFNCGLRNDNNRFWLAECVDQIFSNNSKTCCTCPCTNKKSSISCFHKLCFKSFMRHARYQVTNESNSSNSSADIELGKLENKESSPLDTKMNPLIPA